MNGIKCPTCQLVNMTSVTECYRCETKLLNLSPTAHVSVPVDETFQAQALIYPPPVGGYPLNTEIGRKTFFWYRIYLAVIMGFSLIAAALGGLMIFLAQEGSMSSPEAQETLFTGVFYLIFGLIFGVVYLIGLLLPRRPWNWVVGIIFISLGLLGCCTLPSIPLLIFWIKPETRAYFERM
jgi:hypothetical protein